MGFEINNYEEFVKSFERNFDSYGNTDIEMVLYLFMGSQYSG